MFKEFKALFENQTRKKIKIFWSNNGWEYILNEFIDFCKKETIVPYNLEHKGVVEINNQCIVEVARAMLRDQNVENPVDSEAHSIY